MDGWGVGAGEQPIPPQNGAVISPFYSPGVLDIRWDNPALLARNARYMVVGVNVYRADETDRGPYHRLNDLPLGGTFYRDQTNNTQVRETVDWNTGWLDKGNAPNNRMWVIKTKHPINKRVSQAPYQNATFANAPSDVVLYIDGVEVQVDDVFGPTGEVRIINIGTFNSGTEKIERPLIPTAESVVEIIYHTNRNFIATGLDSGMFYRLTTVVLDPNAPGCYLETDLSWCEPLGSSAIEKLDYIWKEGIRRNAWILQQGGERVSIFVRKQNGIPCDCGLDPRTLEYSQQPSNRCLKCFPPGTEITMGDFTRKNIEQVQVGDSVLTHSGKIRKVTEVMSRKAQEPLSRIKAVYGIEISPTEEHPVLVVRKVDNRCIRQRNNPCTGLNSKKICTRKPWINACTGNLIEPQWILAKDVQVGDYLVFPTKIESEAEPLSDDIMKFLGYYAAEGWTSKRSYRNTYSKEDKRVWFGLHKKETETYAEDIRQLVGREFGVSINISSQGENGIQVLVCSVQATKTALEHVGKYSLHKKLSSQVVLQSPEKLLQFLGTYFNGDGWVIASHIGVSSASYDLIRQVEVMLIRSGFTPRFSERTRVIGNPGRAGTHKTTEYSLIITKSEMLVFNQSMSHKPIPEIFTCAFKNKRVLKIANYLLYPVIETQKIDYEGDVYNLEVEDDHTYIANGVSVHNCFGTGFLGGYEGGYAEIIAPDDAEKRISQGITGRRQEHTYEVFMGPSPAVTQRDFIVKQTNDRYSIGPVRRPSNRGNVLQQHFSISSMDGADIRYQVPLDGTSQYPWPQTRYGYRQVVSMPIDGQLTQTPSTMPDKPAYPVGPSKQLPMETDKQGWPEEKQPRGRTPVWENQNE